MSKISAAGGGAPNSPGLLVGVAQEGPSRYQHAILAFRRSSWRLGRRAAGRPYVSLGSWPQFRLTSLKQATRCVLEIQAFEADTSRLREQVFRVRSEEAQAWISASARRVQSEGAARIHTRIICKTSIFLGLLGPISSPHLPSSFRGPPHTYSHGNSYVRATACERTCERVTSAQASTWVRRMVERVFV